MSTYKYDYTEDHAVADAEFILETVLFRRNWTVGVRDALASEIMKLAYRQPLFDRREEAKRRAAK